MFESDGVDPVIEFRLHRKGEREIELRVYERSESKYELVRINLRKKWFWLNRCYEVVLMLIELVRRRG